jgi:hypothetical protein
VLPVALSWAVASLRNSGSGSCALGSISISILGSHVGYRSEEIGDYLIVNEWGFGRLTCIPAFEYRAWSPDVRLTHQ